VGAFLLYAVVVRVSTTKGETMTRKHYQAIAEAIRQGTEPVTLVELLMDIFEADNPRFDRARFMDACGL
jgi:hypothetical protein